MDGGIGEGKGEEVLDLLVKESNVLELNAQEEFQSSELSLFDSTNNWRDYDDNQDDGDYRYYNSDHSFISDVKSISLGLGSIGSCEFLSFCHHISQPCLYQEVQGPLGLLGKVPGGWSFNLDSIYLPLVVFLGPDTYLRYPLNVKIHRIRVRLILKLHSILRVQVLKHGAFDVLHLNEDVGVLESGLIKELLHLFQVLHALEQVRD